MVGRTTEEKMCDIMKAISKVLIIMKEELKGEPTIVVPTSPQEDKKTK